ncbi:carotenoid biosynthesis protein [Actinomycetes bacterium KLBMP 9797]
MRAAWLALAGLVAAQIAYPLTDGADRARVTVAVVVLGFLASVAHAATRGVAGRLVAITAGGGLAVEALGVATGFPFGGYAYADALGPKVAGVPLVVPLAWTWMAWPAWLAAGRLARRALPRIGLGAVGLAAWDLFLDPQMVAEGYWTWTDPHPALPGVPDVPLTNYAGWLVVAVAMMSALHWLGRDPSYAKSDKKGPFLAYALYLWTYVASVAAHGVFLGLPASAGWGAVGMGLVAVPLAVSLARR